LQGYRFASCYARSRSPAPSRSRYPSRWRSLALAFWLSLSRYRYLAIAISLSLSLSRYRYRYLAIAIAISLSPSLSPSPSPSLSPLPISCLLSTLAGSARRSPSPRSRSPGSSRHPAILELRVARLKLNVWHRSREQVAVVAYDFPVQVVLVRSRIIYACHLSPC